MSSGFRCLLRITAGVRVFLENDERMHPQPSEPTTVTDTHSGLHDAACCDLPIPNLPWVSDEWVEVRQPSGHPPHYYRMASIESIRMDWVDGAMVHHITMMSGQGFSLGSECGHSLMLRVCASQRTSHDSPPPTTQEQGSAVQSTRPPESGELPRHSSETRRTGHEQSRMSPLARSPLSVLSI
jgi:hypothetical protein